MDRHEARQLIDKVEELLRFGSLSCIGQAESLMVEHFRSMAYYVLESTKPRPKPKHTIADNYPAGGLTASEPCAFCVDYEQLQAKLEVAEERNERLEITIKEIAGIARSIIKSQKGG